jgi:hypothetical protein
MNLRIADAIPACLGFVLPPTVYTVTSLTRAKINDPGGR